jgi:hypothetical protein
LGGTAASEAENVISGLRGEGLDGGTTHTTKVTSTVGRVVRDPKVAATKKQKKEEGCVCVCVRERERERRTGTERQRDRGRDRERGRYRGRDK